ncbi:MAG: ABC transporter permease [Candidatus Thorarchaeota archaeon]
MAVNKERVEQLVILFFPVIFLILFFLLPLFRILLLAFLNERENGFLVTFQHIVEVLSHPLNRYFLYWDFQQAIITTGLCVILGIPGSYIFTKYQFPGKNLLRNLITIPFILPPIVVLIGFIEVFGHGSPINQMWSALTGSILIEIYNSYEGILLAHVFYNIPVIIRLTEIGWKNIDPDLIAVARSLRASKFQILWRVQIPHLLPITAAAALLVFIYAFNSFAMVLVLGGVQYQTLEVRIYWLAKQTNFPAAAALTLVQISLNLVMIMCYLYITKKYEIPISPQYPRYEKPLLSRSLSVKKVISMITVSIYFALIGLLCLYPIFGVFLVSLFPNDQIFSLNSFIRLLDPNIRSYIGLLPLDMVMNTLFFGVAVMILATLLALLFSTGIGYRTTYKTSSNRSLTTTVGEIVVILPLAISSITLAFSILTLYQNSPLYRDFISLAIIIAHTLIAFPFAYRILAAKQANIDPSTIGVARSLGSSRFNTWLRIQVPLLLTGIVAAGLFSFAISLGEFGATTFLARANFATIPVGIYRLINTRNVAPAAAFSVILILLSTISFIIIEKLGRLDFRF